MIWMIRHSSNMRYWGTTRRGRSSHVCFSSVTLNQTFNSSLSLSLWTTEQKHLFEITNFLRIQMCQSVFLNIDFLAEKLLICPFLSKGKSNVVVVCVFCDYILFECVWVLEFEIFFLFPFVLSAWCDAVVHFSAALQILC